MHKPCVEGPNSSKEIDTDAEPRRSKRAQTSKYFGHDFYAQNLEDNTSSLHKALKSPDADLWQEDIYDDYLESNSSWHFTKLPLVAKSYVVNGF